MGKVFAGEHQLGEKLWGHLQTDHRCKGWDESWGTYCEPSAAVIVQCIVV